jgi:hypothetical protein
MMTIKKNTQLNFDEDEVHELKMHRKMCLEEISPSDETRCNDKIVRTKQPASKSVDIILIDFNGLSSLSLL